MRIEDYPPQEPLAEASKAYRDECLRLGAGVSGSEHRYAPDHPCQGALVFKPRKPNGSVLVWMHGGGWTNGYKEQMAFIAPALNEAGIAFVSIGYRLAPEFIFPTGWLDAARAIAWAYANADKWGGDPQRIFVGGHSAGAHYAALLAVRRDWTAKFKLPHDVVRGTLPISGIYYFTEGSGLAMRPRFLGPPEDRKEIEASPLHHLSSPPHAPMLLAHGSEDFPHLIVQAKQMEKRVIEAGGRAERIELSGCNHFTAAYSAANPDGVWFQNAVRLMSRA